MPEEPINDGLEPEAADDSATVDADVTVDEAGPQEPETATDPTPEPEEPEPPTYEELEARLAEAEQRADEAERMQRIAEGERDRAVERRDQAQKLTTLAAGLVGQAGMYAVASAIVMADDTHYGLVDEIGEVEEKLVQFSELFDGLVAEASPDAIGQGMEIQKYVSQIVDFHDAGVSAI